MSYDPTRFDPLPNSYETLIKEFETKKQRRGNTESSTVNYVTHLLFFCEWLDKKDGFIPLDKFTVELADEYNAHARDQYADNRYRHNIVTLRDFYHTMGLSDGPTDATTDPWEGIYQSLPSAKDLRDRHSASGGLDTGDVASALLDITHPMWHSLGVFWFKTMVRKSEAINVLLREVHIQDPSVQSMYDNLGINLHSKVVDRPDTIYIPEDRVGNKRKSETVIPIDAELKAALIRYLSVRPPVYPDDGHGHLWVSVNDNYGQALSPQTIFHHWDKRVPDHWRDRDEPVRIHDARHWAERKLRPNLSRTLLRYLRGDSPNTLDEYDDIVAEYDRRIRRSYLQAVPKFYSTR